MDHHADQREQGMVDSMYGGFFNDEPLNCGIFFGVSPCLLPTHRGYGSPALKLDYHAFQTVYQLESNRTPLVGGLPGIDFQNGCFINNLDGDRTYETYPTVGSRIL